MIVCNTYICEGETQKIKTTCLIYFSVTRHFHGEKIMIKTAFTRIFFFFFQDPGVADVYTQHSCNAISAKYSPSGFYIASGGSFTIYPFIKFRDELYFTLIKF